MRGRLALVLTLVLVIVALPSASGEAGRDGDAPNNWEDAWTLEPGEYIGTVNCGEDWYRVETGPDQVLNLTFDPYIDTWADVHVREDDGPFLGEVEADTTELVRTDTDAVRFGVQPDCWDPYTYRLNLTLENATPQDDAGSGQDAGNVWQHAAPNVSLGSVEGELLPGLRDAGDWYTVPVPDDHWIQASSDAGQPTLREPDGDLVATDGEPRGVPSTEEVRVGLSGSSPYALTTEAIPQPDAVVEDVTVELDNVTTDAASVPTGTQRTVHVDLANLGNGSTVEGRLTVWTTEDQDPDDNQRVVHQGPVSVGAGATKTVSVSWDGTGQLGDTTVHARVDSLFDLDGSNDEAQTESYVLVGNVGAGADAGNLRVERQPVDGWDYGSHVHGESQYDHDARYVHLHARGYFFIEGTGQQLELGWKNGQMHVKTCPPEAGCHQP